MRTKTNMLKNLSSCGGGFGTYVHYFGDAADHDVVVTAPLVVTAAAPFTLLFV